MKPLRKTYCHPTLGEPDPCFSENRVAAARAVAESLFSTRPADERQAGSVELTRRARVLSAARVGHPDGHTITVIKRK